MKNQITFDAFREQWLQDVQRGNPSSFELGRRFGHKLFTQWRDINDPSDDLIYCDGSSDGGIDIAYLERANDDAENISGDTWYLVQSKYGTSHQGVATLDQEGRKIIETLTAENANLSQTSSQVIARIKQFLSKADVEEHNDKLVLVYATEMPLQERERQVLDDIRAVGRSRFGAVFDVVSISLETIYLNTLDDVSDLAVESINVNLEASLANSGEDLMVGSLSLLSLYNFLKTYRDKTENLDQIYEKNVRQFLGGKGKVNKAMRQTLLETPEHFGLYNNGITVVVSDFKPGAYGKYDLSDPYIVNGCQTTRTIWEIFQQKLESGGKGEDIKLENWKSQAEEGVVVVKIVRVARSDENLLQSITRYTNSQNAVREKDFVTLDKGFHRWKKEMEDEYDLFLEVQRGGWEARQAYQKQNPNEFQFKKYANAFDLLKVYGSGWLKEAGQAFGRNAAFVPGGKLYRQIVEMESGEPFGVDDLYAAFRLQEVADGFEFGRGSQRKSRTQTRFLFYLVAIEILRDVMVRSNLPITPSYLTKAMLDLLKSTNAEAATSLFHTAIEVIDEYMSPGSDESVFNEPEFKRRFNSDLNGFLKSDSLGKGEVTPMLTALLAIHKRTMGRGSNPTPRELISQAIEIEPKSD